MYQLILTRRNSSATPPVTLNFLTLASVSRGRDADGRNYGRWSASAPIYGHLFGLYYADNYPDGSASWDAPFLDFYCHFRTESAGARPFLKLADFAPLYLENPPSGKGYVYRPPPATTPGSDPFSTIWYGGSRSA